MLLINLLFLFFSPLLFSVKYVLLTNRCPSQNQENSFLARIIDCMTYCQITDIKLHFCTCTCESILNSFAVGEALNFTYSLVFCLFSNFLFSLAIFLNLFIVTIELCHSLAGVAGSVLLAKISQVNTTGTAHQFTVCHEIKAS